MGPKPEPQHEVLALTGIRHSGKSTVCRLFEELGAVIVSADVLAKQAMRSDGPAFGDVVAHFGRDIVGTDGEIDTRKLATIIYNDEAERKMLETLVHPHVRVLSDAAFREALAKNPPLVIYECPLYFEAALDKIGFKAAIVIKADEEHTLERIMARDKVDRAEAERRMGAQWTQAEKLAKADEVLDNSSQDASGRFESLRAQVFALFRKHKRH